MMLQDLSVSGLRVGEGYDHFCSCAVFSEASNGAAIVSLHKKAK